MTIRKRGTRYHYDFMIRRQRYRGAFPRPARRPKHSKPRRRSRTKSMNANMAKPPPADCSLSLCTNTYLPWAKATKRSSRDDVLHAKVFCHHFGKKSLSEIDHQMIEEFKIKRMKSITRYGRPRKPASVNRELAILSGIFRMAVDYEEITDKSVQKGGVAP